LPLLHLLVLLGVPLLQLLRLLLMLLLDLLRSSRCGFLPRQLLMLAFLFVLERLPLLGLSGGGLILLLLILLVQFGVACFRRGSPFRRGKLVGMGRSIRACRCGYLRRAVLGRDSLPWIISGSVGVLCLGG
jgi:hypothetical protein